MQKCLFQKHGQMQKNIASELALLATTLFSSGILMKLALLDVKENCSYLSD